METYISILRGINVSGKNILKMDALKKMYESIGYQHVTTFIQSGNVVFQSEARDPSAMESEISEGIFKHFAMKLTVIVKEKSTLKKIIALHPFLNENNGALENHYICLLSKRAEALLSGKIEINAYLPDKYLVNEDVVYLFCSDGYGNTKLNNNFWEHKLKVDATTRNMKTLAALIKISDAM